MIELPLCTVFRESKETLVFLVSLDLLVLMVSLWVLHSSIYKHTMHNWQQWPSQQQWRKPFESIWSRQFLFVLFMWSALLQECCGKYVYIVIFFHGVNLKRKERKENNHYYGNIGSTVMILCDENHPKVDHMFYFMIKNSEDWSTHSLQLPSEHVHSWRDLNILTSCVSFFFFFFKSEGYPWH